MISSPIRIATRASRLALWQSEHVAERLRQLTGGAVELVHIATSGDRDQVAPLYGLGGQGAFTREVQLAVLDGRADLAVHSLKDLPTEPVAGLTLAAVPERASPFDALVLPASHEGPAEVTALPQGATIGTGSLRRRGQLLHVRPDFAMRNVRGNVPTRLRKLDDGEYDALVLAEAGLTRLGLTDRISQPLRPPLMFPAVGQGALGLECRSDDAELIALLSQINDPPTHDAVTAERTLLAELRGGCHAPVGVRTVHAGGRIALEAVVLSQDGRERLSADVSGRADDPVSLGRQAADELRRQGAARLIIK